MNAIEPLADAVTGGVAGHAVEPRTGEVDAEGHTTEKDCLNCGTQLVGDYCHSCGQRGHVHRSLHAFFHDLLHGVLHFEGKIWRTLPMLAWRPGELTRRYIEGQRASFVSPIALFLFCVFIMFAVLSWTTSISPTGQAVQQGMRQSVEEQEAALAQLRQRRATQARSGQATAVLDRRISDAQAELELTRTMSERGLVQGAAVRLSDDVPSWLRAPLEKAGENPELLLYKLKTNAYKFSWMLIPLSLPFLWLLFPFSRRFRVYDHTVFVTYSLCFMTLLVVAISALRAIGAPGVALAFLIPPIHMYRQLKGAYGLSRGGALWRTVALTFFAIGASFLFLMILVALGIFD